MAASLGGRGKKAQIVGINVTPMVDVVLVLLVIMMVSAVYIVSQSLKVELPKTASSDGAANTPLLVTIQKTGAYLFNQKPIEDGCPPRGAPQSAREERGGEHRHHGRSRGAPRRR